MTHYSRGQQAQITKRVRLRGDHDFTTKDRKCLVCGHKFDNPNCPHTVEENQQALKEFSTST